MTGGATDGSFVAPPVRGRHIYLRGIAPADYPTLQELDTAGEIGVRWRFRGSTPSPEQWMQMAWNNVLAQFVVARCRDHQPIGLVVAYQPNFQHRHAYFAAVGFRRSSPLMVFGCAMFFNYVFTCWDFHKLYMEVPEYNLPQFETGLGRYFEVEARLREHSFYGGRMWDQLILALYRDTWRERGQRLVDAEQAGPPRLESISLPGRGELWRR